MRPTELSKTIILFASVMIIGTIGYRIIEGWSWLDSLWMVVITLTTIGYGEVRELDAPGRLFTLFLIAGGLGVYSYAVTQLTRQLIGGDLARDLKRRRQRWLMKSLENHYVIAGFGRLGREVAAELKHAGSQVVVIDLADDAIQECEDLGLATLQGDASHDDTLNLAGIERAAGLAVATASNAVNVLITLSARQLNPGLMILTRVDSAEAASKARRAGASSVISPYGLGGTHMALALLRPQAHTFVEQATVRSHEDIAFEDIELGEGLVGSLGDLQLRTHFGVLVVAVRKPGGKLVALPGSGTVLNPGDVVVAVGQPGDIARFADAAGAQL